MPVTIVNFGPAERRGYDKGYYDGLIKGLDAREPPFRREQIDHMLHLFGEPETEPLKGIVATLRGLRTELTKEEKRRA